MNLSEFRVDIILISLLCGVVLFLGYYSVGYCFKQGYKKYIFIFSFAIVFSSFTYQTIVVCHKLYLNEYRQ